MVIGNKELSMSLEMAFFHLDKFLNKELENILGGGEMEIESLMELIFIE